MEGLKKAQGIRVDEFSRQRLIESQDTINELTGRIRELQDKVNSMNDSRVFQDVEKIRSGPLSHVPSQPTVVPGPRDRLSRDQSMRLDVGNPYGISRNAFANPSASFFDTLHRNASPKEISTLQKVHLCK